MLQLANQIHWQLINTKNTHGDIKGIVRKGERLQD